MPSTTWFGVGTYGTSRGGVVLVWAAAAVQRRTPAAMEKRIVTSGGQGYRIRRPEARGRPAPDVRGRTLARYAGDFFRGRVVRFFGDPSALVEDFRGARGRRCGFGGGSGIGISPVAV